LEKKFKNLAVVVHVLHTTQNMVISRCRFAEDGKEIYEELKRAHPLFFSSNLCLAMFSLSLPSWLLKLPF